MQNFVGNLPELAKEEMGPIESRIAKNISYLKNSQIRIKLLKKQGFAVVESPFSSNTSLVYKALIYIENNTSNYFKYCFLPARIKTDQIKSFENTHYKVIEGKYYQLDGDGAYVVDKVLDLVYDLLES